MADYSSNFAALLTGHLGINPSSGDEGGVDVKGNPSRTRGKSDTQFDTRDIIASFIGKGYKDLSDDQAKKDVAYLRANLGNDTTNKLMNQIFTFNNRSDVAGKSWQDKLSSFYTIGAKDQEIQKILQTSQSLDRGVIAGMTDSGNRSNQEISGRAKVEQTPSATTASNDLSQAAAKKLL